MIEIVSQSAFASVQDLGRFSAARWGVGTAGAMDRLALVCGNILLGNPEDAAGIEAQVFPFEVRFEADHAFALTGADCAATLDGVPLLPWSSGFARAGQVLRLGLPQAGRWRGARAYLTVRGGIHVPEVLGSRSTQLRGAIGGLDGRMLRQGDRLPVGDAVEAAVVAGVVPPGSHCPSGSTACPASACCRRPSTTPLPKRRSSFWGEAWKITPQSDRYGFRLAGPQLEPKAPIEVRSHGIVPGVIQVPHSGQPIVQMCDAQPSGAIPRSGRSSSGPVAARPDADRHAVPLRPGGLGRGAGGAGGARGVARRGATGGRAAARAEGGMMRPEDLAEVGAAMAAAGIVRLELTGPDYRLALSRGTSAAAAVADAAEPETDVVPVTAPAIGTFLRTHPRPLAADGEAVVAGQAIALLRIGALLTAVPAPANGLIVAAAPEEGALVGYGDRLFDFLPQD